MNETDLSDRALPNDPYAAAATLPPMPNHNAAHSLLSEVQDALVVGIVITEELAKLLGDKLVEAKSHL